MKQIETGNNLPPNSSSTTYDYLAEILADVLSTDAQWVLEFSQIFELRPVQLGDDLVSNLADHAADLHSIEDLYIVCQGRVRLLSIGRDVRPAVPTASLEAGDCFGADQHFCNRPLAYRAIAATDGTIAVLPINRLMPWLGRFPQLQDYLSGIVTHRQQLIFFKVMTGLGVQSSHALKQLLPYVVAKQIPANAMLADATPATAGRFWLRDGQISHQPESSTPLPSIGDHWGYPDPVPTDWVAATELQVYHLASHHWELGQAIAPALSIPSGQTTQRQGNGNSARPIRALNPRGVPSAAPLQFPQQSNSSQFHRGEASLTGSAIAPAVGPQPDGATQPKPAVFDFAKPTLHDRRRWFGRGYPFIAQQSSSDCGAACLAMLTQYWGKQFSLNTLRNLANVGRSGASLKSLANAAEKLGFQTRPIRASFNHLAAHPFPWIAHWQGDHYIVVYQVKRDRVVLSDPALGRRSLSVSEFQQGWTGYALLLNPTKALQSLTASKPSIGQFWDVLMPYRSILWSIILASVLLQIFGLVTPLFTQIILDQVVVHKNLFTLQVFIVGLLLFGAWRVGLSCIRQYLLDYFSNQVDLIMVSSFINHALNLPLQFFMTRHVGDIITRVQENQKIQLFLTRQAIITWLDALMAVVYVALMFYYNWRLALLVLTLIPAFVILTMVASPFLRQRSRQIFHESATQNSTLVEILTGISTVKVIGAERELRWQWEEQLTRFLNAQFRGQKLANGLQATGAFINMLGSTALLGYGATLVIQDQLSIGQFVAFNMMIGNVINPILSLVGLWDEFQEVLVSVERLNDIFSAELEESPDKMLLEIPTIRGEICFENVTFRYNADDDRNILQNISFAVKPGETVAIVGRSGSGKTTLVSLLEGLYQPISGRITIDGHAIGHISLQSLRRQLGVVPQECFLFSGTILDNIMLYRSEYSMEQVLEAATLAEAHAFIQNLPLGYHTKVGERGTMLSGGQRQRIAIARALLSNPRILILDEATSSLDTESERRFQKNLLHISRNRTTFIIAHRLSTVRNASFILVLDRGVIVEKGTHEHLLTKGGLYAQLAQQQLDL